MNDVIKQAVKIQALKDVPNETCGFILLNHASKDYEIYPCKNVAEDTVYNFVIEPSQLILAEARGSVIGYYHSHTLGDEQPSDADKVNSAAVSLPSLIYSTITDKFTFYIPDGYEPPLIGRPFVWGIMDCWALCSDYYKKTFGLSLSKDYFRTCENDVIQNQYFEKEYEKLGFVEVDELKEHDLILMKINTKIINHAGVYLGHEIMLHHPGYRLSQRTFYGSYWKKVTSMKLRHKSLM